MDLAHVAVPLKRRYLRSNDYPYSDTTDEPAQEGTPIVCSEPSEATNGKPLEADP
jgi:hypothetical protein